jgi:hypothetical protein
VYGYGTARRTGKAYLGVYVCMARDKHTSFSLTCKALLFHLEHAAIDHRPRHFLHSPRSPVASHAHGAPLREHSRLWGGKCYRRISLAVELLVDDIMQLKDRVHTINEPAPLSSDLSLDSKMDLMYGRSPASTLPPSLFHSKLDNRADVKTGSSRLRSTSAVIGSKTKKN